MELWQTIFKWFEDFILGFSNMSTWLGFEVNIGTQVFTLFTFLTLGGLITYLGIAIIRWII